MVESLTEEFSARLAYLEKEVLQFIPEDELKVLVKPRGQRLLLSPPSEKAQKLAEFLLMKRYAYYAAESTNGFVDCRTYERLNGHRILVGHSSINDSMRKHYPVMTEPPDDILDDCVYQTRLGRNILLYPPCATSELLKFYLNKRVPGSSVTILSEGKKRLSASECDVNIYDMVLMGRLTRDMIARRIKQLD